MRYLSKILVLVFFAACNKPDNIKILSKKQFVPILVDVHLLDAIVTDYSLNVYTNNVDSAVLYNSIMEKHHTNMESFQATLKWHSYRPEKLSEIYDEVFGILTRREQEAGDLMKLFADGNSTRLFTLDKPIQIIGDTAAYPQPFIIPLAGTGTYLFDVEMRMLADDNSVSPKIVSYFFKNQADSNAAERLFLDDILVHKSNFSRNYQSIYELADSTYYFLKLIVPETGNTDTAYKKNTYISSIKISRIAPSIGKEQKEKR
ncbi:MAG: DUF4296 domain-containing protein [Bacteroidales bacterium]|nr:DUF4296 domain-containing protein [Bacteroidales bacterium]